MVRSRIEDPEIQSQRRQIAQSKSVSELSQIQNLGEFPIPTTIEKLMAAKKQSESNGDANKMSILESLNQENIYATLPRSLKSEVLVRTRVEDPEVLGSSHLPKIQYFYVPYSFESSNWALGFDIEPVYQNLLKIILIYKEI